MYNPEARFNKFKDPDIKVIRNIFGDEDNFRNKIKEALLGVKKNDPGPGTDQFTRLVLGSARDQIDKGTFVSFRTMIKRLSNEILDEIERHKAVLAVVKEYDAEKIKKEDPVEQSREKWKKESKRTGNPDEEDFLINN